MQIRNRKSRRVKPKTTLISTKETNKVVLSLMGLVLIMIASWLCILILLATNNQLANKRTVFVQQPDGTVVQAQEKDENYRADEVIQATIANWLPLMFEWDNRIAGSKTTDRGIQLGSVNDRFVVPTKVYMASFLLAPGLRWELLKAMSTEIPKEVYRGDVTSIFEIHYLGKPIRKENAYEINVMATRTDISQIGQSKRESRYHKTITLIPVEPYRNVLGKDEPSAFRKQLAELKKNGLAISLVRELKSKEI